MGERLGCVGGGGGIHHIVNLSPFSYQVQAASSTESYPFVMLCVHGNCVGCYGRTGGSP